MMSFMNEGDNTYFRLRDKSTVYVPRPKKGTADWEDLKEEQVVDAMRIPLYLEKNNCLKIPCHETYVPNYLSMYSGR